MPITLKFEITLSDDQLLAIAEKVIELRPAEDTRPLTPEEAAKPLRCSPATVRRRIEAGIIRVIPGMSRLLIPAAEIKRVLEGRA